MKILANKTFFYVLTIQGQLNGVAGRQKTIRGTITISKPESRLELFDSILKHRILFYI